MSDASGAMGARGAAAAVITAIAVLGAVFWMMSRDDRPVRAPAPEPADCVHCALRAPGPDADVTAVADAGPRLPRGLTPDPAQRAAQAPAGLDLSTPERAIETQVELLRTANYNAFRETFLPSVQLQLTDRVLDACRLAVVASGRGVEPNWARADNVVENGHAVRRVPVLRPDDAFTGFHQIDGRWLADFPWCEPKLSH